jgi:aminoglycoside 6'-N-acetyltransferase I
MLIERCTEQSVSDWVKLREALWPNTSPSDHRRDAMVLIGRSERAIAFLARAPDGNAIGFAEATLRVDYVNGCETSPVAFLEGIYVHPGHRLLGVARRLCWAVEGWASERGCAEFASNTELANIGSQRMHEALGFEETERVVYFRKAIAPRRAGHPDIEGRLHDTRSKQLVRPFRPRASHLPPARP